MDAVEGNCFVVQSLRFSMMTTMTRKKHLESMSKDQAAEEDLELS